MAVDTIEGVVQGAVHYHYDVEGDVLYLRVSDAVGEPVHGEEDDNGFHVLRSLSDDRVVGMTIVGFWRQFGEHAVTLTRAPDWEARLEHSLSRFGKQLLAA